MTLAEFEPLTEAEQVVIAGLGTGHVTKLGDGFLPGEDAGEDRRVRASLIRWLALDAPGEDDVRLHEKGLQIAGALVVSDGTRDPLVPEESTPGLDLDGCTLDHDLLMANCRFQDTPVLLGAKMQTLNLQGAHLPGLQADRLKARGSVFLRGVQAKDEVRLLGARIGGNLECDGGRFENKGDALNAGGARVTGMFFWRAGSHADGAIDLTAAEIGHINDDPACWPKAGNLLLDRCRYGAFTGRGISAAERIRWLDLQKPALYAKDFWPQPWEHCAQVLREMGLPEDARQVLIAKEERQRRVRREQAAATLSKIRRRIAKVAREADPNDIDAQLAARSGHVGAWCALTALRLRDGLLGTLIAYGHRPLRAIWWLAGMWIFGAMLFGIAWGDDGFKPNNAFILRSAEWAGCYEDDTRSAEDEDYRWKDKYPSTLKCFLDQSEADGYPAFNGLLYSLDTLVPVVDLEVQDYWVPDEAVAGWARVYLWVHIAMGWFLALLAVAGFSGLVQTRATSE